MASTLDMALVVTGFLDFCRLSMVTYLLVLMVAVTG